MAARVPRSQVASSVVAALGEPRAARVAVVDEDRGQAGVGVQRRRDPADVPPVRGGDERQHPDRRVLGGVGGPRDRVLGDARRRRGARPARVHHTALVGSDRTGRSSGCSPMTSPVGRRRRNEVTWVRTSTAPNAAVTAPHACGALRGDDVEGAHRPGLGRPAGVAGAHERAAVLEVELDDDERLALVHVDRARRAPRSGPGPRRWCPAPGRCGGRRSAGWRPTPAARRGRPPGRPPPRTSRAAGGAAHPTR